MVCFALQKLILSETAIYDVLHDFFYHSNNLVCMAALEVYVRRAYIAYELESLQHSLLASDQCLIEFAFLLPSTHPNRLQQRRLERDSERGSVDDMTPLQWSKCIHLPFPIVHDVSQKMALHLPSARPPAPQLPRPAGHRVT